MGACKGVFYNATNYTLEPINSAIATTPNGPSGTWQTAPVTIPPGGETNLAFYGQAPGDGVFGKVLYQVQGQPAYTLGIYFINQPPGPASAEAYNVNIPGVKGSASGQAEGSNMIAIYALLPGPSL